MGVLTDNQNEIRELRARVEVIEAKLAELEIGAWKRFVRFAKRALFLVASSAIAQTATLPELITVKAPKTTCTVQALRNLTVRAICSDGSQAQLGQMGVFATEDIAILTKRLADGSVEMQIATLDADGKSAMKHQGNIPQVNTSPRYVIAVE